VPSVSSIRGVSRMEVILMDGGADVHWGPDELEPTPSSLMAASAAFGALVLDSIFAATLGPGLSASRRNWTPRGSRCGVARAVATQVGPQLHIMSARRADRPEIGLPAGRHRRGGLVPHHCHALNDALALEVIEHVVLCAAVVPHRDGARRPVVAHRESRALDPPRQVVQHRLALLVPQLDDPP